MADKILNMSHETGLHSRFSRISMVTRTPHLVIRRPGSCPICPVPGCQQHGAQKSQWPKGGRVDCRAANSLVKQLHDGQVKGKEDVTGARPSFCQASPTTKLLPGIPLQLTWSPSYIVSCLKPNAAVYSMAMATT